jgi:hypothetical protein
MRNYYDINVSYNGSHFFATSERSCTTKKEAQLVFIILAEKFPESEGYKITTTYWQSAGARIEHLSTTKKGERF